MGHGWFPVDFSIPILQYWHSAKDHQTLRKVSDNKVRFQNKKQNNAQFEGNADNEFIRSL